MGIVDGRVLSNNYENDFRKHFETHYADSGARYEDLAPSYEFGFQMATDPKFDGQKFHDVESEIKSVYLDRYPASDWETNWDALFYGWEKAGGAAGGWSIV
jgi:hypothetical protein